MSMPMSMTRALKPFGICMLFLLSSFPFVSGAHGGASQPLSVFVLAGQSNMNGAGKADELPDDLMTQENALFTKFWGTEFKPLTPKGSFGPEVMFGREMSKALNGKVGLIKLANGGTSLKQHWNPMEFDKKKGVGVLRERLIGYVKNVKKKNPKIKIAGMLWMQGEADSRYGKIKMEDYRDKLEALIDLCRKEFGDEAMPFVCGRINPPKGWNNREQVRKAQEGIRRKHYAFVNCDDLSMHKDNLHYDSKGQLELGKRFAAAMLKLLNKDEKGSGKPNTNEAMAEK